jgi:translation initiation factor 6 (eIF-6)
MRLEQEQEQNLLQVLKIKLIIGCILVLIIVGSVAVLSSFRNFIRTYRPLPTSQLHHVK